MATIIGVGVLLIIAAALLCLFHAPQADER